MSKVSGSAPLAPAGFDKDSFFKGIYWHQRWEIFNGVFTPGRNPVAEICATFGLPQDLSGKRVLDIGTWNGCFSFECERRGAREVIALGPENPHLTGFYRIRDAIGSTRTRYLHGSVYDLNPEKLGYFDVVLFCGVLYHLRYPLLGIDNIRRVCRGEVFIETFMTDTEFVLKEHGEIKKVSLRDISPALLSTPLWQFYQRDELENEDSNWFGPNALAVIQAFESAGFEVRPLKAWDQKARGTFHARVKEGVPEFLAIRSGEGCYYDVLVRHLLGPRTGDAAMNRQIVHAVQIA
jgi:tRNA (mo5U34)-methyltransferase